MLPQTSRVLPMRWKILIVTGSPLLLLRRRSTGCRWLWPGLPLSLRPLLLPAVLEVHPFRAPHIPLAHWLLLLLRPPRRLHAPAVVWEVVGALVGGGEAGAEGGYGVCWSSLERGQRGQERKTERDRKEVGKTGKKVERDQKNWKSGIYKSGKFQKWKKKEEVKRGKKESERQRENGRKKWQSTSEIQEENTCMCPSNGISQHTIHRLPIPCLHSVYVIRGKCILYYKAASRHDSFYTIKKSEEINFRWLWRKSLLSVKCVM